MQFGPCGIWDDYFDFIPRFALITSLFKIRKRDESVLLFLSVDAPVILEDRVILGRIDTVFQQLYSSTLIINKWEFFFFFSHPVVWSMGEIEMGMDDPDVIMTANISQHWTSGQVGLQRWRKNK